jgi:hypothetical protein
MAFLEIFHRARTLLTLLALVPLVLVLLMIAEAAIIEGESLTGGKPGDPNIGLGLLWLALMVNVPI